MTLKAQREFLKKKWKIVPLRGKSKTEAQRNRRLIRNFSCPDSTLEHFLKREAWEEDESGAKKIYLILARREVIANTEEERIRKSKNPKFDIVGYFGLCSGMLYIPENERDHLTDYEEDFVQGYVDALTLGDFFGYRYESLAFRIFDADKANKLLDIGEKRFAARNDRTILNEKYVQLVDEAYPSIEITHLCKNKAYVMPTEIDLRFSHYVFWDCIQPIIMDIASKIGVQYVYLFAAEKNIADTTSARKLLNLYRNDLQFRPIEGLYIMKPEYDYSCISMFQEIKDLPRKRIGFWTEQDY